MKISRYLTIALSALVLMGCGADNEEPVIDSNEMQFSAILPNGTRVDAMKNSFEEGDKMGLYVTQYDGETPSVLQFAGNYANNIMAERNATSWVCTPKIFWPEAEGKLDVYAYYPYGKPNSIDEYDFKVANDQSTVKANGIMGGFEASDFLFAKAEGVQKVDVVPLKFRHCMSKLRVRLIKGTEYEGEFPDDMEVYIHNTVTSSTIDLATGTVTKKERAPREIIKSKKKDNANYEAIIVPQHIDKAPLIEIVTKGVSYLVESRFAFKPGIEHVFDITINGNPDQIKIEIGGDVAQNNMN